MKGKMMKYSEKIVCLDIVEHIRKCPSLYIANKNNGDSLEDGIYSLFREVLENAIDEVNAGFCDSIDVVCYDNSLCIRDYGRGIPLESLPLVLTKAFSGGKFDNSIYDKSIGMHGLGLKVVSALSENFYCKTFRNGYSRKIATNRGKIVDDIQELVLEENGCEIFFQPDHHIFGELKLNSIAIRKMLRMYCGVNPALKINFNNLFT